ncbi:MAG: hypothetical protein GY835_17885 [bacterium]|nr:hypothetical protein [bacterium]
MTYADLDFLLPLLIFAVPAILQRIFGKKKGKQSKPARSKVVNRVVHSELTKVSRSLRQVSQKLDKASSGSRSDSETRSTGQAGQGKEELPAWLSNLVEEIGGGTSESDTPAQAPTSSVSVRDVSPVGLERAPSAAAPPPLPVWEQRVQDAADLHSLKAGESRRTTTDAELYHAKRRVIGGRTRILGSAPSHAAWRRAIVLTEVLGKPKALQS